MPELRTSRGIALATGFALAAALAGVLASGLGCGRTAAIDPQGPPPPDPAPNQRGRVSALWGEEGEAWQPDGRLPDFSYAGYGMSEVPLPEPPVVADVSEYGAAGDGVADDTEAFLRALAAASDGAVLVPPGRYKITRPLEIRKSNIVLRGSGRDETTLFFPLPLFDVLGQGEDGGPWGWSWGGGWVRVLGEFEEGPALARVTADARRGQSRIAVSSTRGIEPGQWVRVVQTESDGSLSDHLHAGCEFTGLCTIAEPGFRSMDWTVRVRAVEKGVLDLGRPLRLDLRAEWKPHILPFLPTVEEVGIENLTIEFPVTTKPTHHKDRGYNAIEFRSVFNGWVRGVRVVNFDNAIHFWFSRYITGRDLLLEGRGGHYGLGMGGSQDSLMTRFRIRNTSFHDLSVANLANGCVFSRGRGPHMNFDHHRGASYENLFSKLQMGDSWENFRLWECSDTPSGHFTAARETFWNVRPKVKKNFVPLWPQINIIGPVRQMRSERPELDAFKPWIESIRPRPGDLHAAQLARRLAALHDEPQEN